MVEKLKANQIGQGKILYATLVEDTKTNAQQLEIGIEVTKHLLGEKVEDGTENVSPYEVFTRLHLDEVGDAEAKRRGIARDNITRITDVELEMSWESETGWMRLHPDHPHSIYPAIEGKEVLVRATEYAGRIYHNLYFPRVRPKVKSFEDIKKRHLKPY